MRFLSILTVIRSPPKFLTLYPTACTPRSLVCASRFCLLANNHREHAHARRCSILVYLQSCVHCNRRKAISTRTPLIYLHTVECWNNHICTFHSFKTTCCFSFQLSLQRVICILMKSPWIKINKSNICHQRSCRFYTSCIWKWEFLPPEANLV
jgi:hypothetical protein